MRRDLVYTHGSGSRISRNGPTIGWCRRPNPHKFPSAASGRGITVLISVAALQDFIATHLEFRQVKVAAAVDIVTACRVAGLRDNIRRR